MTENEIKKMHKEHMETVRKELINAARRIQRFCHDLNSCDGCPFKNEDYSCGLLNGEPESWEV